MTVSVVDFLLKTETVDTVRQAFRTGSAAHAYIVECSDRYAVEDVLKIFSSFAVCSNGACGVCSQCRRALRGVHCDVKYFPSDSLKGKITVADTDLLIADTLLKPLNAQNKVYLLNAFDSVSRPEWQNKLLKTLEEPPENTFIFLAVANAEALLQTVRSRCEIIRIPAVGSDPVEKILLDGGVDKETAAFAAGVSQGQLKKATEIAENHVYVEIAEMVAEMLARMKNTKKSPPYVAELIKRKADCYVIYEMMEVVLRDGIALCNGLRTRLPDRFLPVLSEVAVEFSPEAAAEGIKHVEYAKRRSENGGNFTVVIDQLILKILEDKYRCRL